MALPNTSRERDRTSKKGGIIIKTAFIETMKEIMAEDENTILITADMGFSVFEELQEKYPTRFINSGVTEQASASVAAGMALAGRTVFFYAQAAFSTMRCFEQVRLDVAYNFLNVKIIGVNAGFSLNQLGVSHFAVEDIGLMRLLPGMTIFSPADPHEMAWSLKKMHEITGPTYLRYTKLGDANLHNKQLLHTELRMLPITEGNDILILAAGGITQMAREIVDLLKEKNISASLLSVPVIKPLDTKSLLTHLKGKKAVFTIEEHSREGGLGTAVIESLIQNNTFLPVYKFGAPDKYISVTGSIPHLLAQCGLEKEAITEKILQHLS